MPLSILKIRQIASMIVALAMAAFPATTRAQADVSGNYWLNKCESPNNFDAGLCLGFVVGVHTGYTSGSIMTWLSAVNQIQGASNLTYEKTVFRYCHPDNMTNGQLRDIFINYLKKNPEIRHKPADGLLIDAMILAFPCRPK